MDTLTDFLFPSCFRSFIDTGLHADKQLSRKI